jgi:putative phosphoribosyl transferase
MSQNGIVFRDRQEAGALLAEKLRQAATAQDGESRVLALPRGGVPVGYEIAQALHLPLDLFLVRKLGMPQQEELAFGAIASGGHVVIDRPLCDRSGLSVQEISTVIQRERVELLRRERRYGASVPVSALAGGKVILVDDGIATGNTMLAAVQALRRYGVSALTVAVPVLSSDAAEKLMPFIDALVYLHQPEPFIAVGRWYQDFRQVSDDEVIALLTQAQRLRDARVSVQSTPENREGHR